MTPPAPADIRAARTAAGLSQRAAAALIGNSTRAWEEWESGRRTMPAAKWFAWQTVARNLA